MSAIGSEKKQKMSSGVIEQENPIIDPIIQLTVPGVLHHQQEMPVAETAVLKMEVKVTVGVWHLLFVFACFHFS